MYGREAQRRREQIRTRLRAEGVPRRQANERSWAELAELYPPPTRPVPAPAPEPPPPGEHYQDADGGYLDVLDWCCKALGWHEVGKPISRLDAPGPRSWGLYIWAATDTKSRKEFFSLWTAAHKRESSGEDESAMAEESRRQMAELEAMLVELRGVPADSAD